MGCGVKKTVLLMVEKASSIVQCVVNDRGAQMSSEPSLRFNKQHIQNLTRKLNHRVLQTMAAIDHNIKETIVSVRSFLMLASRDETSDFIQSNFFCPEGEQHTIRNTLELENEQLLTIENHIQTIDYSKDQPFKYINEANDIIYVYWSNEKNDHYTSIKRLTNILNHCFKQNFLARVTILLSSYSSMDLDYVMCFTKEYFQYKGFHYDIIPNMRDAGTNCCVCKRDQDNYIENYTRICDSGLHKYSIMNVIYERVFQTMKRFTNMHQNTFLWSQPSKAQVIYYEPIKQVHNTHVASTQDTQGDITPHNKKRRAPTDAESLAASKPFRDADTVVYPRRSKRVANMKK